MPRLGHQARQIKEFKVRFSAIHTDALILRLKQQNLVREAEIAVRELLKERSVPPERIPSGYRMDPQTKLFWDLIGTLREHAFEEEAKSILFLGFFDGMSRFDLLRAFGQVILKVQRLHSPLAPELQTALDRCMAEVRKVCPHIKEDPPTT
jgi:hypothetical protein